MRGIDINMFLLFDPLSPNVQVSINVRLSINVWSSTQIQPYPHARSSPHVRLSPYIWLFPHVWSSPHIQSSPYIWWMQIRVPNPTIQPSLITPGNLTKEPIQGIRPRNLPKDPVLWFGQMSRKVRSLFFLDLEFLLKPLFLILKLTKNVFFLALYG